MTSRTQSRGWLDTLLRWVDRWNPASDRNHDEYAPEVTQRLAVLTARASHAARRSRGEAMTTHPRRER